MVRRTLYHKLDLRPKVGVASSVSAAIPKNILPWIAALLTCVFLCGCSHLNRAPESRNYETIVAEPNRDQVEAQRLNDLAIKNMQDGKWDKAIEALQAALVADVTYGPAHNNLGRSYYAQRKFYLAAWELQHAINEMPNHAEPINNLGLVYEAVGRHHEALEQYETAYAMESTRAEYIGNLARVRLVIDYRDPSVTELLRELIYYDTRPNWVCWAREQLGLRESSDEFCEPATEETYFEQEPSPEYETERLPAPDPQWMEQHELQPPQNQLPIPNETTDRGFYLQRSPIAKAKVLRFPPAAQQIAAAIPSSYQDEQVRKASADVSKLRTEIRQAHHWNQISR